MKQKANSGSPWEEVVGYSRAIRCGNIIEVAGTTAMDGEELIGEGNIYQQTFFILGKIEMAIKSLGGSLTDVIRTRMFVTDISLWKEVAKAHSAYFNDIKPVTTMVEIKALIDVRLLIEIEATACLDDNI